MRIDFDANEAGLGDIVCMGWVAQGVIDAGHVVTFYLDGSKEGDGLPARRSAGMLLHMMGFRVAAGRRGIRLGNHFPGYNYELRARGKAFQAGEESRVETWADVLPFPVEPRRPTLRVPEKAVEWARKRYGTDTPRAVLFPEASYPIRRWPINKWVDLDAGLRDRGYHSMALMRWPAKSEAYRTQPYRFLSEQHYALPIECVVALLQRATVAVSADSGGGHIAGLAGTPTVIVSGPTRNVFTHYGCAFELRVDPDRVPCVGCHFQDTRPACNGGCEALMLLSVPEVLEAVSSVEGVAADG